MPIERQSSRFITMVVSSNLRDSSRYRQKNISFSRGGNFYFLYYQSIRLKEHCNFDYRKFKIWMIGKEQNEDLKSTKFEAEFQKPDTLVPRYTVLKRKTIVTTCISSVLQ